MKNRKSYKNLKSLNIRDYTNSPSVRKSFGFFKKNCYDNGELQSEYFKKLVDFAHKNGFFKTNKRKGDK